MQHKLLFWMIGNSTIIPVAVSFTVEDIVLQIVLIISALNSFATAMYVNQYWRGKDAA